MDVASRFGLLVLGFLGQEFMGFNLELFSLILALVSKIETVVTLLFSIFIKLFLGQIWGNFLHHSCTTDLGLEHTLISDFFELKWLARWPKQLPYFTSSVQYNQ